MPSLLPLILQQLKDLEANQKNPQVSAEEWQNQGNQLIKAAEKLSPQEFSKFDRAFQSFQNREKDAEGTSWVKEQYQQKPYLETIEEGTEIWHIGGITLRLPHATKGISSALHAAISKRKESDLQGYCDCGASAASENGRFIMDHQENCAASDSTLKGLLNQN